MEPSAPSFVVVSPTFGATSPIAGKVLQTVAYPSCKAIQAHASASASAWW